MYGNRGGGLALGAVGGSPRCCWRCWCSRTSARRGARRRVAVARRTLLRPLATCICALARTARSGCSGGCGGGVVRTGDHAPRSAQSSAVGGVPCPDECRACVHVVCCCGDGGTATGVGGGGLSGAGRIRTREWEWEWEEGKGKKGKGGKGKREAVTRTFGKRKKGKRRRKKPQRLLHCCCCCENTHCHCLCVFTRCFQNTTPQFLFLSFSPAPLHTLTHTPQLRGCFVFPFSLFCFRERPSSFFLSLFSSRVFTFSLFLASTSRSTPR